MRSYGVAKALSVLAHRALSLYIRWTRAVESTSATPSGLVRVGLALLALPGLSLPVPFLGADESDEKALGEVREVVKQLQARYERRKISRRTLRKRP